MCPLNRGVQDRLKGGRIYKFAALVVVGDGNGIVGFGLGKASEVPDAIRKGIDDAKKNLIRVNLLDSTIPHEVLGTYGAGHGAVKARGPRYRRHRRRSGARRGGSGRH